MRKWDVKMLQLTAGVGLTNSAVHRTKCTPCSAALVALKPCTERSTMVTHTSVSSLSISR